MRTTARRRRERRWWHPGRSRPPRAQQGRTVRRQCSTVSWDDPKEFPRLRRAGRWKQDRQASIGSRSARARNIAVWTVPWAEPAMVPVPMAVLRIAKAIAGRDGGRMTEDAKPVAAEAGATVTGEELRKAEAYVEAEEGVANRLAGWSGTIVTTIAVVCTLFHLYAAYDIVPTQPLRYTHVAFVMVLCFLMMPFAVRFRDRIRWWDVAAAATSVAILVYAIWGGEDFTDRATTPARLDVTLGVFFLVLLLEATRPTTGLVMPVL